MSTVPQELNWVEKRAACTIARVFNELCYGIQIDVETLNSALNLREDNVFSASLSSARTTLAVGQANKIPRTRVFVGALADRISVKQEWDGQHWSAVLGLNNEGRCILRLEDDTELEQWQFRKKALEGLFFGVPQS